MKNKSIYIFELVLVAFIIVLKFVFIDNLADYYRITLIVFWLISFFLMYRFLGLRKYKSFLSTNAKQLTIIITMLYFLLTYLSGLYLGFLRNSYSLNILDIFNNSFYLIVMIISEELIRTMIAEKCTYQKFPLVILTILYILLDIVLVFNVASVNSYGKLFVFISSSCLPIIARNVLCSYLAKTVGFIPSIIYRLVISIYIYFVPILPDMGYYISSILGVVVPYIIYSRVSKLVKESDKQKLLPINKKTWYLNIPLIIASLFFILLVSGILKYQIMAIGSGSMEPVIYRGDTVIFEKYKNEEKSSANIGEILVFIHNGRYITHRVIDKTIGYDGILIYQTKGDNNESQDNFVVRPDEVVGVVKMKVSYIGFPSLWIQELFSK